jgi:hypothetical protein
VCCSMDGQHGQSCHALCAKADLACTGVVDHGRDLPAAYGDLISQARGIGQPLISTSERETCSVGIDKSFL